MSFNLTAVTRHYAICVTDRRLTRGGAILSERSTKLTTFVCKDAHGFITYNGIGTDMQGVTPSDWICDISDLGKMPLDDALVAIKADADARLADEVKKGRPDTRHTFVIGGYHSLKPFIALVSNYERIRVSGVDATARAEMEIERWYESNALGSKRPYIVVGTGAVPRKKDRASEAIIQRLKTGAAPEAVRAKMIKVVRNVAYATGRKGSVGTSVLSAMTYPLGGFDINSHVPGGTTLLEGANSITADMTFKDLAIDISGKARSRPRYDPITKTAPIDEPKCGSCGTPVPEGYRRCGACDAPAPGRPRV